MASTSRGSKGKFVKRIYQDKRGRWLFRRDDGTTVVATEKQVKGAKRRGAKKEKEAQAKRRRERRLKKLLQYRGKELRAYLAEEKRRGRAAKKRSELLKKQEANQRIWTHLMMHCPEAEWEPVDISFYPGTAFYHRTWRITNENAPAYYAQMLAALEAMRDDVELGIEMEGVPMGWCSVRVQDPEIDHRVGESGGHALSSAFHWENLINQAIENPWKGMRALMERYRKSLVYGFTITHYKQDPVLKERVLRKAKQIRRKGKPVRR